MRRFVLEGADCEYVDELVGGCKYPAITFLCLGVSERAYRGPLHYRTDCWVDLRHVRTSLSSILTPARIPHGNRPQPIPSLNPFGGLMLVSALQHHIFGECRERRRRSRACRLKSAIARRTEYGSQSDFYYSVGVQVPVLSDVEGIHGGFEGRRKVRESRKVVKRLYH